MNAKRLAAASGKCQVYLLGGGIEAWKRAGLPVSPSSSAPRHGLLARLAAVFR